MGKKIQEKKYLSLETLPYGPYSPGRCGFALTWPASQKREKSFEMHHKESKKSSGMVHQPRPDLKFVGHGNFSCSVAFSFAFPVPTHCNKKARLNGPFVQQMM
jgi:hypothetical protein